MKLTNREVLDCMQVNIIVAENFDQTTNSMNKILTVVDEKETLDFYIYLTIRMKRRELSQGMFDIHFDLIMEPESDNDKHIYGMEFSSYCVKFKSQDIPLVSDNNSESSCTDDECLIFKDVLTKIVTVKRFENIPLNGKGEYRIVAYLSENDKEEQEIPFSELILDSFQFVVK